MKTVRGADWPWRGVLVAAVSLLAACDSGGDGAAWYDSQDAGGGAFDGGVLGRPDASAASDGHLFGVDGGGSPADAGGTRMDGAVSMDAAGSVCFLEIVPVSRPSLDQVPAGPSARIRLRADFRGNTQPDSPAWTWTVRRSGTAVPFTQDPRDGAVIEFSLPVRGDYDVTASVGPDCPGRPAVVHAVDADQVTAIYRVRITPPATLGLLPLDRDVTVSRQSGGTVDISLGEGTPVTLLPRIERDGLVSTLKTFIRVGSREAFWIREGDTSALPFSTTVAGGLTYDVLLVPLDRAVAPLVFRNLTSSQLNAFPLIQSGARLTGTLRDASGPVPGARLLLHDGGIPSSIGEAAADGRYALEARPALPSGRFAAVVLPPPGSTLPEARIADAIVIPGAPGTAVSASFTWRALPTAQFSLSVFAAEGTATVPGTRVRIESDDGALPDVGSLEVTLGSNTQTWPATGKLRAEAVTDAAGAAVFASLPRTRYHVTFIPPAGGTSALTTTPFDLTNGDATAVTFRLAARVKLSGRLGSRAAGARLIASDDSPEIGRPVVAAQLDATGAFTLLLDPERRFHLVVDPGSPALPRLPLDPVVTARVDTAWSGPLYPASLPVTGIVRGRSSNPVGQALVQVFCLGAPPDCVDRSRPAESTALPLYETRTDARGAFELVVPDPAAN